MNSTIKPLTYGEDAYSDGAGSEMYIEEIDNPGTQVAYVLNYGDFNKTLALAQLFAAAPDMYEALHIQRACGAPEKVSLYDEEGVEGWRWTHPDGREWTAVGAWDEAPPMHPVASAAIAKARGDK